MQPIDLKLIARIYQMVNEGVCNIREIERDLQQYVRYESFTNENKLEFSDGRFYPCRKDIRNHFNLAIAKQKLVKKDQSLRRSIR